MPESISKYNILFENKQLIVKESGKKYEINLSERVLTFAVDVIRFVMRLPDNKVFDVFRYQLPKAATSIGANYEESQAGSYAEFKQRIQICLRESKESHFWLRVIDRLKIKNDDDYIKELNRLLKASQELKKIFGSISSKINKKQKNSK